MALHAGLICFVGEPMPRAAQVEMLHAVLDMLAGDMPLNERIEVEIGEAHIQIERYPLPSNAPRDP